MPSVLSLLVAAAALVVSAARPSPPSAGTVYSGRANETRVRPPRIEEAGHVLDGRLDERQWAQAALLTGFSQFSPQDGTAAEDSTEVLVWYSPTAIHFGVRAFEPHGSPRASLADRDRIANDDNVQLLLGTFNDGRQATVFAVNPLGVQADGTIVESNQTRTNGIGGGTLARDPADLSADYVYQSRGRVTPEGYVVEIRIPFKSLKYQSADVQTWSLNVVRQIQHSGHEDSWTPARRAGLSFLGQSGSMEGLTGLRRGLVVDVNPELTQRTAGLPVVVPAGEGGWHYAAGRPEVGGNARWGITTNLTLNGTVNPDFSQIESDAGQLAFDPRQALFFAEKRPFFLEGIEQFATPNNLIHTRSIVQPVVAAKLSGKVSGTSLALLTALDDRIGSYTREHNPLFNVLRVQRDLGASSKVGVAYTDRVDGPAYNRVADVDGSYLFGGIYSVQGQYAQSYTREPGGRALQAPLWSLALNRNGKNLSVTWSLDGVHEDFRAASGFVRRGGVANAGFTHRYTMFGAKGALMEALTFSPSYVATWRYQSFVHRRDAIEKKGHVTLNATWRGGWSTGAGYFGETFGFDPDLYASYRVLGAAGDTLPFVGTGRIPNSDGFITLNTPQGNRISANVFYLWGHDENFHEWASSDVIFATYGITARPTDKLRLNVTYNLQGFNRRSDGSIVGNTRIPRLKMEYQLARPVFVRLVGEYQSQYRDALRDEGRTGRPLLVNGRLTSPRTSTSFRGDFLFSYQPDPGTVVFVGYGAGYSDRRTLAEPFEFPRSLGFRGFDRTENALFVKASYLFRL
ncbi:MAG: hypothetical protein JWL60_2539 [Gemmatimonadetes bacterium]|jgi:hypothetical protein|nr:hypothetical protein [Gemmatimonadota bacterium]